MPGLGPMEVLFAVAIVVGAIILRRRNTKPAKTIAKRNRGAVSAPGAIWSAEPAASEPDPPNAPVRPAQPQLQVQVRMMKRCPTCAEDVWAEARVCRHCHHEFAEGEPQDTFPSPSVTQVTPAAATTVVGADASPEGHVVYETIEVLDYDTGKTKGFGSDHVRHYLVARHRGPHGSSELPLCEVWVKRGLTGETLDDWGGFGGRGGVNAVIDELESELIVGGWEVLPGGSKWYSRAFRRVWREGTPIDPVFSAEATESAATMRSRGVAPSTSSGQSFSN